MTDSIKAEFELVVIGAGPGGYVAAIRAAQLGLKTAIIERYPTLGGTCLNVGCIPSKALLDSSEKFLQAKEQLLEHGIKTSGISLDFSQMMKRKAEVISQTTRGIDYLMKQNKIERFTGEGSFVDPNTIQVNEDAGKQHLIYAQKIIIATGSKPATLPQVAIDKRRIISSTEALSLKEIPRRMIVIGAGAIGLELASVFARLDSEVQVLEYMDRALPLMDAELGRELGRILKKQLKLELLLSHQVQGAESSGAQVKVTAKDAQQQEKTLTADYCLVAVGRKPYTERLGLESIGITLDKGRIPVNNQYQTFLPHIYAIGDVIGGMMLAHKAAEEGIAAAELIAGEKPEVNYLTIPQVVYTNPEVSSVGYSEEALKEGGRNYRSGKFFFRASGRARASGETEGFVKVLADASTDEILGVHMIGPRCADIISEAVLAMEFKAAAEDIGRTCHPHPTFSEALHEACLAASRGKALHS